MVIFGGYQLVGGHKRTFWGPENMLNWVVATWLIADGKIHQSVNLSDVPLTLLKLKGGNNDLKTGYWLCKYSFKASPLVVPTPP